MIWWIRLCGSFLGHVKMDSEWAASRNATSGGSWCLQKRPWCATTCPYTSVCSSSSSQWHPRLRSSPLTPRLSCTWLAWKKNAHRLSPLFYLALWCLKCDCSWIVAAFPWRFWHEKQTGLSGLPHGQWSRTKTINLLTVGYYYQGEWGTRHRGFLSHEIHF